jgi:hypothetical protein
MRVRRFARSRSRGQETLQTILVVAFVLLPILVGIFTFGSVIHLYIGEQAAAAQGARISGADGGFGPTEYAAVVDELTNNGVDSTQCNISASAGQVSLGDPISVTVSCPQTISIPFLLNTQVNLTSTFVSRGEVNQ